MIDRRNNIYSSDLVATINILFTFAIFFKELYYWSQVYNFILPNGVSKAEWTKRLNGVTTLATHPPQ